MLKLNRFKIPLLVKKPVKYLISFKIVSKSPYFLKKSVSTNPLTSPPTSLNKVLIALECLSVNIFLIVEYAKLFDVDPLPVIFKGKLNEKQLEIINLFLHTSEDDLDYVFGENNPEHSGCCSA